MENTKEAPEQQSQAMVVDNAEGPQEWTTGRHHEADRRIYKFLMALDAQDRTEVSTEPPALGCFDALKLAAA